MRTWEPQGPSRLLPYEMRLYSSPLSRDCPLEQLWQGLARVPTQAMHRLQFWGYVGLPNWGSPQPKLEDAFASAAIRAKSGQVRTRSCPSHCHQPNRTLRAGPWKPTFPDMLEGQDLVAIRQHPEKPVTTLATRPLHLAKNQKSEQLNQVTFPCRHDVSRSWPQPHEISKGNWRCLSAGSPLRSDTIVPCTSLPDLLSTPR
mmetsp:Transcript_22623/g.53368  ORF Transcript_22623/g.53368 Transcript_22623/m.53368 type:complete len:201 (+) Transcript_22623:335-937(+)